MYKIKFDGYASVFNVKDHLNDVILPLSFSKNNIENIKLLYEHDANREIGFIVDMYQDEVGLYIEGIVDTNDKNVINMILDDTLNGLSIGYMVKNHYYKENTRIITDIELLEISLVARPANKYSCIKYKKIY